MIKKEINEMICIKKYISEKEYKEINDLKEICNLKDKTNLKLELDYKLNRSRDEEIGLKNIDEFLYYVGDDLVSYLGISSFGGNIGEINGMTHPDFRRKGIFKKLFQIAIEECRKRNFNKILLLTDGKSHSGIEFIKSMGGKYDFSEYSMKLLKKIPSERFDFINLRKVIKKDEKEIVRQNVVFFNDIEGSENFLEEEEKKNKITYMVELHGEIIGKIRVNYKDNLAFICGFGILPSYRGKGYGRATLVETLYLIKGKNISDVELDVECKNSAALNLYKSCGFEEKSIMNYYNLE